MSWHADDVRILLTRLDKKLDVDESKEHRNWLKDNQKQAQRI